MAEQSMAQDRESLWQSYRDAGQQALRHGRTAEAEQHFRDALEVAEQFGRPADGKVKLDLESINCDQLQGWGIPAERIYSAGICTFCTGGEFHSFRRDREKAGRMLSVVGILP